MRQQIVHLSFHCECHLAFVYRWYKEVWITWQLHRDQQSYIIIYLCQQSYGKKVCWKILHWERRENCTAGVTFVCILNMLAIKYQQFQQKILRQSFDEKPFWNTNSSHRPEEFGILEDDCFLSHTIHGNGIFPYMKTIEINHPWIGKYTSPMDDMGFVTLLNLVELKSMFVSKVPSPWLSKHLRYLSQMNTKRFGRFSWAWFRITKKTQLSV